MRKIKDLFWRIISFFLNYLTKRIAGKLAPGSAEAWRAVQFSYSHLGEDLVLLHLLKDRICRPDRGVYVDVGAFHPTLFSNTYLLHQHGWKGVNIDANKENIPAFILARPDDITLCEVLSDCEESLDFLYYPTSGLNRSVLTNSSDIINENGEFPLRRERFLAQTLSRVLNKVLPVGTQIDLLTVDCEGNDLKVLSGLDWDRYKPILIAVEGNSKEHQREIREFLFVRGYTEVAILLVTQIFKRNQNIQS